MATELKLPRLGQGMESGTIVRWLKSEGDDVKKREPLYELDTDKVTQEVEAEADGVLLRILVTEGEVEVGRTIGWIGESGEEASEVSAAAETSRTSQVSNGRGSSVAEVEEEVVAEGSRAPARDEERERGGAVTEGQPPAALDASEARVKASPLARRIARERGVDLAALSGTGPEGRIIAEDVEKAAAAPAPSAPSPETEADVEVEVEVVKLTSTRKTIARRLTEAWQAPVFQLVVSAEMTEVLALREQLVEQLEEGGVKPTVNDVLTKLVAVALTRHPAVNATFTGEEIHRSPVANVGIAVAAPNGLIVPVIRSADRSPIAEIARTRADLVGRARDGKLTRPDLQGGTFTISNLGMYGVEQFVALLNPPQVAILAVGAVKETALVVDGEIDIAPVIQLTLTCDHRAIDGAEGAEFLRTLVALVEQPALAL